MSASPIKAAAESVSKSPILTFIWYFPVTGAVKVLDAKSPFWSNLSVPKAIVVALDKLVCVEEGVAWKAGCSGLVTAPILFILMCSVTAEPVSALNIISPLDDPSDNSGLDAWIDDAMTGKINNCWKRMQTEWTTKLMNDSNFTDSIPSNQADFVALVIARDDYKTRKERDDAAAL